jgi:predicted negative regulator of RcsB-dependent stress response
MAFVRETGRLLKKKIYKMAQKKVSRKELLKKPDEFLTFSAKAIIFAKEHIRQFQYLGIALLGLVVIFIGINAYLKYINKQGQNSYNMAFYAVSKNMDFENNQDGLKESEELFSQVIDKYGLSKASLLALPELAYIKFLQKEYDEAIAKYLEFLDKVSDDPYKSLTIMALAVCYEEKGDYEEAIRTLEEIRSGPDDFFKEQALLSLARVYRLANNEEKSNEILNEFIDKFKKSSFLSLAEAQLK